MKTIVTLSLEELKEDYARLLNLTHDYEIQIIDIEKIEKYLKPINDALSDVYAIYNNSPNPDISNKIKELVSIIFTEDCNTILNNQKMVTIDDYTSNNLSEKWPLIQKIVNKVYEIKKKSNAFDKRYGN